MSTCFFNPNCEISAIELLKKEKCGKLFAFLWKLSYNAIIQCCIALLVCEVLHILTYGLTKRYIKYRLEHICSAH